MPFPKQKTLKPLVDQQGAEEVFDLTGAPGETVTLAAVPLLPLETVQRETAAGSVEHMVEGTDYTVSGVTVTVLGAHDSGVRALYVVYRLRPSTSSSGHTNVAIASPLSTAPEDPVTQPRVAVNSWIPTEFARIKARMYKDTEEVRDDIPTTALLANGSIYVGVAPDGTPTTSAVWTIIRSYFDANAKPTRERIRFNVAWDSRTSGWS